VRAGDLKCLTEEMTSGGGGKGVSSSEGRTGGLGGSSSTLCDDLWGVSGLDGNCCVHSAGNGCCITGDFCAKTGPLLYRARGISQL
jgi:hypothetical protein